MDRWKKKWLVPYIVIASVTSIIHPLHIKSKTKKKKQTNETTYISNSYRMKTTEKIYYKQ